MTEEGERIKDLEKALAMILQWRELGREAVLALPDQNGHTKGYIQACDQAIEDVRRAASGVGVEL